MAPDVGLPNSGQTYGGAFCCSGDEKGVSRWLRAARGKDAQGEVDVSFGDPLNSCRVLDVEVSGEDFFVVASVLGCEHDPGEAKVSLLGSSPVLLQARGVPYLTAKLQAMWGLDEEKETVPVCMAFPCHSELQLAQDVLFSYAPGYTPVSILDRLRRSLAEDGWSHAKPCSAAAEVPMPAPPKPLTVQPAAPASTAASHGARPLPLPPAPTRPPVVQSEAPAPAAQGSDELQWGQRAELLCGCAEAGHARTFGALQRRLRACWAFREAWAMGDASRLCDILEASSDQTLVHGALAALLEHSRPIPPGPLSRLVPLAQSLAQSDREANALVAMRFCLQLLQVSWPPVAKSMRNVATPKATWEACQALTARLSALFSVVKAMSRSVRISRTNGPLVPVCRKLKTALEEALSAAGRVRAR